MQLCDYGCGQEATHQFKNGKWCCDKKTSSCPATKEKIKNGNLDKNVSQETGDKISKSKKGQPSKRKGTKCTLESRNRMSISMTGKIPWNKDKRNIYTKESLEKNKNSKKISIEQIQERYCLFSKIEEMRYNPYKPIEEKEIQVRCKNSNCENSKENSGWFSIITHTQLYERIRQVENGNGGSYFYCSQYCKNTCPLYRLNNDPFKDIDKSFRSQVWNEQVLKQDNYECQKCGSKENLHCHHIRPVKLEPEYSLDPSNGIVLCQTCHIKYGHKKGTECSMVNLAKMICKKKGK